MKSIGLVMVSALLCIAAVVQAAPATRARSPWVRISMDGARAIALARVPGTIRSGELEREHGRLVYSFDIKVKGRRGIEEVQVDAKDGSIVSVKHESARQEREERRQERKEAAKRSH
jgi:hypothetical protein